MRVRSEFGKTAILAVLSAAAGAAAGALTAAIADRLLNRREDDEERKRVARRLQVAQRWEASSKGDPWENCRKTPRS